MTKEKKKMEFRYYEIPPEDYILPKLGKGWEQEYGVGYEDVLHFHNHMEIGYCYHGDGTMILQDRTCHYAGGNFTIIAENIPHTTISSPGNICKWEYLFIDVRKYLQDLFRDDEISRDEAQRVLDRSCFFLNREEEPRLASLIEAMIEECRNREPFGRDVLKGYLYAFLGLLIRRNASGAGLSPGRGRNSCIDDAIRYIYNNYRDGIRISDAANACGLSESHFRRVFEEKMGMKPVYFLNLVRVREACRIIEREDYSMHDICFRVGYETPSTFNRNFRRLTGMTPYEWKKEKGRSADFFRSFRISAQKGWEAAEPREQK